MSVLESLQEVVSALPPSLLYTLLPFVTIATVFIFTRVWTTIQYHWALSSFTTSLHAGPKTVEPAQIPYTIPWLGNTLSFLATTPGKFWSNLFSWHPRSTGALTLLIGGRKTHILYSPYAIQALFKARTPNREVMEHELYTKVFSMPLDQIHNAEHGKHFEVEMNAKYMTNIYRVNELTAHFTRVLDDVLQKDAAEIENHGPVRLYQWLRNRMFVASVTALMGEKLLEMYPAWVEDFFGFDNDFLPFFFSKPAFLMKEANARRQRIFQNLEQWSLEMHRLSGGKPVDPETGPDWEPYFGSRLNRARHIDYKDRNLNSRSGACLDAGMTFAIASNAIPATGWMLFYILNPSMPSLYPRVLNALKEAQHVDGSLDIPKLMSQPLLQSIWIETLRLCVDVLVSRTLTEDMCLPLDGDGKSQVFMRKGDNCFAPCWVPQHDPSWSDLGENEAPYEEFDPDRFLVTNAKTGEQTFSMSGTAGRFFPFGGGKTICPGRIFAKQEALGALAMILLRFEFDVVGFVDAKQKSTTAFPGFKKAFPGTAALVPGGDMVVRIRQRV